MTAFNVPLAVTICVKSPCVTVAVRYSIFFAAAFAVRVPPIAAAANQGQHDDPADAFHAIKSLNIHSQSAFVQQRSLAFQKEPSALYYNPPARGFRPNAPLSNLLQSQNFQRTSQVPAASWNRPAFNAAAANSRAARVAAIRSQPVRASTIAFSTCTMMFAAPVSISQSPGLFQARRPQIRPRGAIANGKTRVQPDRPSSVC